MVNIKGPLAACRYLQKKYPFKYKLIEVTTGKDYTTVIRYLFLEEAPITKTAGVIHRKVVFDSEVMK